MEYKTKVVAADNEQIIHIERAFDIPVESLFRAFTEAKLVAQWMGTRVVELESRVNGCYLYETEVPGGYTHRFRGVIHTLKPNVKIIRTFEMESGDFGVQLEVLDFFRDGEQKSKLVKKVVYESVAQRDANLKLPFRQGINWAHNQLESLFSKIENQS